MNKSVSPPVYRTLSGYLKNLFGEPVHRVTVRGGFTCPNRDGTRSSDGCAFCSVDASAAPITDHAPRKTTGNLHDEGNFDDDFPSPESVKNSLLKGIERVGPRFRANRFIAYFNDYSATYAPVDKLRSLYSVALGVENVVGLALGTRPDCLNSGVLELLEEFAAETFLWVELGLQSASQKTLDTIGRRHTVAEFETAVKALASRGVLVCAHVILGLPGENKEHHRNTADFLSSLPVGGVKIHNLHILRGSRWEKDYSEGRISVPGLEEHAQSTIDFLEHIPPEVVIYRLVGDAPPRWLVAPEWCRDKHEAVRKIQAMMLEQNTWQGKALGATQDEIATRLPSPRAHLRPT